jgi:hypothetical protein
MEEDQLNESSLSSEEEGLLGSDCEIEPDTDEVIEE